MCALILLFRRVADFPVVLAANRDEYHARPASGPRRVAARIPYVAPLDQRAGGTWLGTNAAGVTAAVTNRQDGADQTDRPSRGELVPEALAFGSAAAARHHLVDWLAQRRFNGFHLLIADALDAWLIAGGSATTFTRLEQGAHIVTNEHALGELTLPAVERIAAAAPTRALLDTVTDLVDVLGNRTPQTAAGFVACKDHGERGTRSSTLIARGEQHRDKGLFLHADGPPDRTPYLDYGHLLMLDSDGPLGRAKSASRSP